MARHPSKFVRGSILWEGHIYSPLPFLQSHWSSLVHAAPCGGAAFPSVYRNLAQPLAYLPHSERWHAAAALLLVAGGLVFALGSSYGLAPMALGLAAIAWTIGRCAAYSLRSDIRRIPAIAGTGRRTSTVILRLVIALLHFLQPLARLHGRIRGWLHPSRPRRVRRPLRDAPEAPVTARFWRWAFGWPIETLFWGEAWVDAYAYCTRLARNLRARRSVRGIEIDDGWWEDRDLTVDVGWGLRLDAQVLVEDHGIKGCLCRVGVRLKPTPRLLLAAGAVAGLLMAGTWSPDWFFLGRIAGPVGLVAIGFAGVHAWRVFGRATAETASELGMIPLDARPSPGGRRALGDLAPPAGIGGDARVRPQAIFRGVQGQALTSAGLGQDPASSQT
jgi:hypothetical protein